MGAKLVVYAIPDGKGSTTKTFAVSVCFTGKNSKRQGTKKLLFLFLSGQGKSVDVEKTIYISYSYKIKLSERGRSI